jgi:Na+-driven multidrug efflux pump
LAPVKAYTDYQLSKDPEYDSSYDDKVQEWLTSAQSVASSLLRLGILLATVVASLASLIPAYFGNFITSDGTVQNAIKPLAKYLWMGAFFWAPVAVSEGVLLARRELGYLASVYLVSTALLPAALLRVKFQKGDVGQVWACFTVFQICRATLFTAKIWGGRLLERMKRHQRISDSPASANRRKRM